MIPLLTCCRLITAGCCCRHTEIIMGKRKAFSLGEKVPKTRHQNKQQQVIENVLEMTCKYALSHFSLHCKCTVVCASLYSLREDISWYSTVMSTWRKNRKEKIHCVLFWNAVSAVTECISLSAWPLMLHTDTSSEVAQWFGRFLACGSI